MAEGSAAKSLLYTSGVYSRTFDSATNLKLVEVNNNIADAEAEAVAEPSTVLGTTIFLGLFVRRQKLTNKWSNSNQKFRKNPQHQAVGYALLTSSSFR